MKTSTFVEPDSKTLEQCIFAGMFIRDGSLFLGGGEAGQFTLPPPPLKPEQQKLKRNTIVQVLVLSLF